ncbi:hypothetical protein L484_019965 [Morus notabilis]|uniref:Kinesin motor domain-containing protein n=1 Tax=Morus notabilis TaxID=981085 RepID=W9R7L6_9ROSA|nr:hypothetical protein L484_019965 [Morus notabilis]
MDYQTKVYGGNSNGDPSEKIVIKSNGEAESLRGGFSPPLLGEEKRKGLSESKFQRAFKSPVMSEPSAALAHHVGHKFHEVFQLKQGHYMDLPASKISEMMKSNNLDNAPTQSLLSVVNGILDESVERKNSEIPHRVACLLRKVVQEIERRISTQAEHLRTQNNLFKAREEKYQSRIRVLEALASGTNEESEIVLNQLQRMKNEKTNREEKKQVEDENLSRLMKEKDQSNLEISALKQELETTMKSYEMRCLEHEKDAKDVKSVLEERLQELELLLADLKNKVLELESYSETKCQSWSKKENTYQSFMEIQFGALRELRLSSDSIKQEIIKAKESYAEEFSSLGVKLKALSDAAQNYHSLLAENRKMFNELQELRGNIRVYCRIRPFLPGKKEKKTTVERIDENGELIIANPSKAGKEAEVFSDIQPLIRSVLDGYNVCILAYGQTGSGKTYTMTGPNAASKDNWGVNYRALNDLFAISQNRRSSITYEIGVQMVEIYNEQSQPNGLAIPDASMHPVKSTSDVIELMDIGLKNRSVGATALNERSSRSHSCVTVHVRGLDLKTGAAFLGNLHLVDLAGSERVDRSEVTGDRLKEAQHINKSLSALGDVIFSLAQKSPHVPYRNSKLTQVLQSSLGGQAKALMFVQLNPDVNSYSETLSTLRFAERVSGVELGAAKSNKEGRDVRELVEQVASLKNTIAKKDEEIERLQLLKDLKNVYPATDGERRGSGSLLRYGSASSSRESIVGSPQKSQKPSSSEGLGLTEKAGSEHDNSAEYSDKHYSEEADSQQSKEEDDEDTKHQNDIGQNIPTDDHDHEILRFEDDADTEERLSDISDGGLSVGTELTDGSAENAIFADGGTRSNNSDKPGTVSKISRPSRKPEQTTSSTSSLSKGISKVSSSMKRTPSASSLSVKPPSKRWQ